MPKQLKFDPSKVFNVGPIKVTRTGTTVYIYLFKKVMPFAKRNCSDEKQANSEFQTLTRALRLFAAEANPPKRSIWQRIFKRR